MWVYDVFPLKFVFPAYSNKLQGFFFFTFFFLFFFLKSWFLAFTSGEMKLVVWAIWSLNTAIGIELRSRVQEKKGSCFTCMWYIGCHVIALVISQIPIRFMVLYQYQFICIHLTRSRSKKVSVGLGKGWLKFCIYANLRVNSFLIANGKMEKRAVRKTG